MTSSKVYVLAKNVEDTYCCLLPGGAVEPLDAAASRRAGRRMRFESDSAVSTEKLMAGGGERQ